MILQLVSRVCLGGACLAAAGAVDAQGVLPATAKVNEFAARATLVRDAIELELPLTAPCPSGARIVVQILSPQKAISGETTAAIAAGSRSAHATLPWPKNPDHTAVEEIGWYRIAYRIEVDGKSTDRGLLSIGAITPNLLSLRMARPHGLATGVPFSVRVFAGNPVTRRPFRGVRLKGTLALEDGSEKNRSTVVRVATTGANGEAILTFPGPAKPGAEGSLKVEGTLAGLRGASASALAHAVLTADVETREHIVFHTEMDKPLHKPGETVHLRTLVWNDAGRAAGHAPLTLTIKDPESKTLLEASLTTNQFGIAAYDWKTTPQTSTGDYEASFDEEDTSDYGVNGTIRIPMQRYELPEFQVTAAMDRTFYLAGQTPMVKIHAGYLFGKPVAAGTIKIMRSDAGSWHPRGKKAHTSEEMAASGALDTHGDASFPLDVQDDFDDLSNRPYERFRDLQFRAVVTDASTGRSEPRTFTVRLSHNAVHVYLGPPAGDLREGDVMVSASYADGVPASCKIELDWMDENSHATRAGSTSTNQYGLAKVHLRYPETTASSDAPAFGLRVTARDPEGRVSSFDDTVRPDTTDVPWISVSRSLLRPGEPIQAAVHAAPGALVDVDVLSATDVLSHLQVRMRHRAEPVTLLSDSRFHGLITVRAYRLNEDDPGYMGWSRAANTVLYPEDRELRLKAVGLKGSYLPGAQVDVGLRLKDGAQSPVSGAIGIAVFDSAVAQRAETEEDANNRWFGAGWWESGVEVGGITLADLNKVNTAEPIPDDLELAAEAVLGNESRDPAVEIEAASDESIRNEYERQIEQDLKPLGAAIVSVATPRLPESHEAVLQIAREAHLDTSLLDPWDTPFRVERTNDYWREFLRLISAGPDKKLGTEDDLSIDLAQRSLFAVPGGRLNEILRAAAAAGRTLPADRDALKVLAAAGGLDLDSAAEGTRTPEGHSYNYRILVQRNLYSIQVYRENELSVWSSPAIDYFSSMEARMAEALQAPNQAAKGFPATEAEARQVFANAGIDLDTLRDPLGQPLELRVTQLMAYSVRQQITAGASLKVNAKPVSEMMRAIQIVRPRDHFLGVSGPGVELVAQFVHPLNEQSGSDLAPRPTSQGSFQGNSGAIGGTVTDPSGAVIPRAVATVKSSDGASQSATTDEEGAYLITGLAPGIYRINVDAPGFQSFQVYEVRVYAASLTTVDVELRVGTASETVEVSAATLPQLETSASVVAISRGVAGGERKTVMAGERGRATISEPAFTPRLRHVFDETAYWAPSVETNTNGRAGVGFRLPDSLTTWKLHALASTIDGRVGALDETFKTFQPFFVDLDAPQVLTEGDEIGLPVNLRNYTAQSLTLPVTVKTASWFQLSTATTQRVTVPAGASTPVKVGFRATAAVDEGPLGVSAANAHEGDAVEKKIRVHPDGLPASVSASSLLRGGSTVLKIEVPPDVIPGSMHAELRLYPNLGAQVVHSMKASLERPYGCGEQTISSTYPSLLFLELLKDAKASSENSAKAQEYLELGYARLQSYFDTGGGVTYWGRGDPDPALTAYAVEFLVEARPFVHVDQERIVAAMRWLLSAQQGDGSWSAHYGGPAAELTLYVANTLVQSAHTLAGDAPEDLRKRVLSASQSALAWADHSAEAVHDPYVNALRLQLGESRADKSSILREHDELMANVDRDRDGAHWSRFRASPFYGWGRAGDLETTAIAFSALEGSSADRSLRDDVLSFLLRSRDRYGIWYSGQATVRVLKALLPLAVQQLQISSAARSYTLAVNGSPLNASLQSALQMDTRLLDAPRSIDLTPFLKAGGNELVFTGENDSSFASAEVAASFYTPWPAGAVEQRSGTTPGKEYGLDFGYRCQADNARVGQPIECSVDARRFGSQGYGMILAEVGIPPGADADRVALSKLLEAGTIFRYELQPDRIVFYLWPWRAEGIHFRFSFTPRYAIRAKAAPATLSDYYNPDMHVVLAPQSFEVEQVSPVFGREPARGPVRENAQRENPR